MPIYLKYGSINGDVTAEGYQKWIELNSFQWGVGRGISSPTGGSDDRESSAPSVSEVVVTKAQDVATIKLITEGFQGEGEKAQIDFTRTDKGKLTTFLTYVLTNTMLSGYSVSSGGDRPSESLSLNFTKIEVKETPAVASGKDGTPESVTYDLSAAKVA